MRELAGHGVPVLVDGAQGAGAIPVDVEELGADYYVSAQKWLLGPPRLGRSTSRRNSSKTAASRPRPFFWELPDYEFRNGAVRFEGSWTPAASIAGLRASLAFAAAAETTALDARARRPSAAVRCFVNMGPT